MWCQEHTNQHLVNLPPCVIYPWSTCAPRTLSGMFWPSPAQKEEDNWSYKLNKIQSFHITRELICHISCTELFVCVSQENWTKPETFKLPSGHQNITDRKYDWGTEALPWDVEQAVIWFYLFIEGISRDHPPPQDLCKGPLVTGTLTIPCY